MSVCNLRLWFYIGGLNSYFEFMSDHNNDTGKLTFKVLFTFFVSLTEPDRKRKQFICAFHLLM